MNLLAQRLLEVHDALANANLSHAFGGAIALSYCTRETRIAHDIDVNVFVAPSKARTVYAALPEPITSDDADVQAAIAQGRARLWWQETAIDVFFDIYDYHEELAEEVRFVPFEGRTIPVVDCTSLAVFKALIGRTKDWVDIERMAAAGAFDVSRALLALQNIARRPEELTNT